LASIQDREIGCYCISCKEKENIGKVASCLANWSIRIMLIVFPSGKNNERVERVIKILFLSGENKIYIFKP